MFEGLKVRIYFRKVKKGTVTAEEAARKLHCSAEKFQTEYEKYYDPFQKQSRGSSPNIWEILTVIISMFALFFAGNANQISVKSNEIAIKANGIETSPELKIEDKTIALYWDQEGKLIHTDYKIMEDDFYAHGKSIAVPSVLVKNVGRATAKNIVYDWKYEDNLNTFINKFSDVGINIDVDITKENNNVIVNLYDENGALCEYSFRKETGSYIATEEEGYITIPSIYVDLLAKYCFQIFPTDDRIDYSRWGMEERMPQVEIAISYYNVYDERMEEEICMRFKPVDYKAIDRKAGACMFQICTEDK